MLKQTIDVKVRPLSSASLEKASLAGAAHLYISKDSLVSLTGALDGGRACLVERLGGGEAESEEVPLRREASLWVLPDKNISPNVVMMTRAFQEATGFKIGDQVRLSLADGNEKGQTADAGEVALRDVTESPPVDLASYKYPPQWESPLSAVLDVAKLVFPGMILEGVVASKLRRTFKVISVDSQQNSLRRFKLASTVVKILNAGEDDPADGTDAAEAQQFDGELKIKDVPGMTKQADELNAFLDRFVRPLRLRVEDESCGLVIHGGRGTGKTFLLQRLAATNWGRVHWIMPSAKLSTIREVLEQARSQKPSIVLLDDLDELIVKDRSNRDAVIETLCDELDALSKAASEQRELPKMVVVATCSDYMTEVPEKLQTESRFERNITMTIPRVEQRLEILRHLDPELRPEDKEAVLSALSQRTHAYTPRDLRILIRNARGIFNHRMNKLGLDDETAPEWFLNREDVDQALTETRPTAMHDINLQPPTVHWQDIGGQEAVKKVLTRMIKNTKSPSDGRSKVRRPTKGLLLYGPPGCSKTLTAQALATESSFNFFAVKGAELLNMYVGETERAVRLLFQRARAASPSIIFFDEIDSIGGQRSSSSGDKDGGAGGGPSRGSTGSLNILTTLLTEMDGFEALNGVLILGATNRPDAIDSALMRPGRFDRILYVGPPDQAAREAIFTRYLRDLELSDDVDIPALAAMADGRSGAEIDSIVSRAYDHVLDRHDEDETAIVQVTMADLTHAMENTRRNITPAMIHGYERWSQQFNHMSFGR